MLGFAIRAVSMSTVDAVLNSQLPAMSGRAVVDAKVDIISSSAPTE